MYNSKFDPSGVTFDRKLNLGENPEEELLKLRNMASEISAGTRARYSTTFEAEHTLSYWRLADVGAVVLLGFFTDKCATIYDRSSNKWAT